MPMYEYRCEEDGATITLLRPMAAADDPVEDPEGRGRVFRRMHSTFAVGAENGQSSSPAAQPGVCPCGHPGGMCGI